MVSYFIWGFPNLFPTWTMLNLLVNKVDCYPRWTTWVFIEHTWTMPFELCSICLLYFIPSFLSPFCPIKQRRGLVISILIFLFFLLTRIVLLVKYKESIVLGYEFMVAFSHGLKSRSFSGIYIAIQHYYDYSLSLHPSEVHSFLSNIVLENTFFYNSGSRWHFSWIYTRFLWKFCDTMQH